MKSIIAHVFDKSPIFYYIEVCYVNQKTLCIIMIQSVWRTTHKLYFYPVQRERIPPKYASASFVPFPTALKPLMVMYVTGWL